MHHIGQCRARVLIISAMRQFPPGAPVAGSLIYIKTKGMVGYAVMAGYRLRNKGIRFDAVVRCVSNKMIATMRKQIRMLD